MITPATSPQYFAGTASAAAGTTAKKDIDKDAFLKLLVQQLKHQDPLNPLKPEEFASQLAQFSSVEQLTQIKSAIDQQTEASGMAALVQQTSLSASLIGKEVQAIGDQVSVPLAGSARVTVDVAGRGGAARLTLTNDAGAVVATRSLGQVGPGTRSLALPADLPPGTWHYAVSVTDSSGAETAATTYTSGVVSSLEFKRGSIVLHIGDAEIALTDIVRIAPASATDPGRAEGETVPNRGPADRLPPGETGDDGLPSLTGSVARLAGGALRLLPGFHAF